MSMMTAVASAQRERELQLPAALSLSPLCLRNMSLFAATDNLWINGAAGAVLFYRLIFLLLLFIGGGGVVVIFIFLRFRMTTTMNTFVDDFLTDSDCSSM